MPAGTGRATTRWSRSCAGGSRVWDRSRKPRLLRRSVSKRTDIATALAALEAEGFAMRGRFTPGTNAEEWCERRLLARIHHYTVKRLRAEIEPVAARDFLRFLLAWQRVAADARMEGPGAVDSVVAQLEGFEAPAGAWETEILPARLAGYEPHWLDDRCLAGRVAWARLRPRNGRANGGESRATPVRTTPITLLARRHAALWASLSAARRTGRSQPAGASRCRSHSPTRRVVLRRVGGRHRPVALPGGGGAGRAGRRWPRQLGQLRRIAGAAGAVGRAPADRQRASATPHGEIRHGSRRPVGAARRSCAKPDTPASSKAFEQEAIEHVARTLLQRYGVVFWRLLEREAAWLPPWRDLLRVYRRLESRGDIRGGRFVAGFSGEQFALPDAIGTLREVRRQPAAGNLLSLSGADPLNLVGILTPGPRLAALTGNRLLYRDGLPVALLAAGEVQFLETLDAAGEWEAHKALLRAGRAPSIAPDSGSLGANGAGVSP